MSNKQKPILFRPTEKALEMIEEIKQEKGYAHKTNVIAEAIIQMHAKVFPAYVQKRIEPLTPEEKIKREEERQEIRKKQELDKKLDIANRLEGTVEGTVCKFYRYSDTERYEMEVPLARLSEDMVETQYSPSKEKVLELQKKKKTKY